MLIYNRLIGGQSKPAWSPYDSIRNFEDATRISEIYNHYVLHSTINFGEQAVSVDEMKQRIAKVLDGPPWLMWVEDHAGQGVALCPQVEHHIL